MSDISDAYWTRLNSGQRRILWRMRGGHISLSHWGFFAVDEWQLR